MCGRSKGSFGLLLLCLQLVVPVLAGASTSEAPKTVNKIKQYDDAYFTYAKPSTFNTIKLPFLGLEVVPSWNLGFDGTLFRSRVELDDAPVMYSDEGSGRWMNGTWDEAGDMGMRQDAGMRAPT
jgi:hypothetical protein